MTRQANLRVVNKRKAAAVLFRNPDCQWQGSSQKDCTDKTSSVAVRGSWPLPFTGTVIVCSTHHAAYIKAASAAGVLA